MVFLCGHLCAGGMPTRSNWPSILLSVAISRSPCSALICTWLWLSAAVENVCIMFRRSTPFFFPPSMRYAHTHKQDGERRSGVRQRTSYAIVNKTKE